MEYKPYILGLNHSLPDSALCETEDLYQRVGHNTGNLAFHYAIRNQLNISTPAVHWEAPVEKIDAAGSMAILPCANQVGAHLDYGNLAKKFSAIKNPIVAIGLGAQAGLDGKIPQVPQGTLNWLKAISEHSIGTAPNISVRGPFSKQVLEHYGFGDNVVALGCPTLFINPDPELGKKIANRIKEPKRIAVAAGHQRWMHLSKIEASLARMVTVTNGSYIGQSPLEMVKLTRGEADKLSEFELSQCRDYAMPEMDIAEFSTWSQKFGNVFFDIPAWMEHYRHFDFVIGARIHGIMLALQAGIPAICIVHDSRTHELCTTMKVPFVMAKDVQGGVERKKLLKLFDFDPDEFDNNRKNLYLKYKEFLFSNNLKFGFINF